MSRIVYVVRHAQSQGGRHDRAKFGPEGAGLIGAGIEEAKSLQHEFAKLGINTAEEPVAISDLKRTFQTAQYAGFVHIIKYAVLNEINTGWAPEVLDEVLKKKQLPTECFEAAQTILKNPPAEKIWITHGLVIAGLAHELGIPTGELFKPAMGSITKLELL